MEFNEDDIIKFYELLNRLSNNCTNIGVIARNSGHFKLLIKRVQQRMPKNAKLLKFSEDHYTFIVDEDMEISYIRIKNTIDLKGRNFKRYVTC